MAMRREDVGIIVSRSLAIWVATLALREFGFIPMYLLVVREAAATSPNHAASSTEIGVLIEAIISVAGNVMISTLLWTKANLLFKGDSEPIPEATALSIKQIRSTVFTGLGIYLSVRSFSTIMQAVIARQQFAYLATIIPNREQFQWVGPAIEMAIGMTLIVWFGFGGQVRALMGTRGE